MSKLYSLLSSGSIFGLFLQVLPITLLVGAVYAVCRCVRIKRRGSSVRWGMEIMRWLFVCYLTGLVNLVLVPAELWMSVWAKIFVGYSHGELAFFSGDFNLVPTVFRLIAGELTIGHWVLKMLIYNFLMFVPFGFFLPFVSEKTDGRTIWKTAVIVPLTVEIIQPVVGRSFDADDLILNFAGIIAGYFLAFGVRSIMRRKENKC